MKTEEHINYQRVSKAISYIHDNYKNQPSLDEIAEQVHLSPFHFQKIFTDWAGTSPKKFLQYITVSNAKNLLKKHQKTLFNTAIETGLSGTGRLHDLFIKIEGMTPAEYKNGGENLSISYNYQQSPFGRLLVASTEKGICYLAFTDKKDTAHEELVNRFPNAKILADHPQLHQSAMAIFTNDWNQLKALKLHLKGTHFQLKVWEALLKIPMGQLATYGQIAREINSPKASRAVGSAIGNNPIAFIIPCHRVIQSTGEFGQYHWGSNRKKAIIGWEGTKTASMQ